MARLTARPRPVMAFLAGLLLFAPSATFIAAVQVIATANAGTAVTVAAMLIVITLTVLMRLAAAHRLPRRRRRRPRAPCGPPTAWLVAHGRTVVVCCLAVAGVVLVVDGALGLTR